MRKSEQLGKESIPRLLFQQAAPASVGFLIMSIYGIVDTIFVGRYVGSMGIAAIAVVMPITFLISSIGMAIGVGGASIISRALGSDKQDKAFLTFGNQAALTLLLATGIVILGSFYRDEILILFGGRGDILPPAQEYFTIILYGVPFLAWAMMSNNVIRSEGASKVAMFTLIVPAVVNMILDPIFIIWLEWGIAGAAWATTISYAASAFFTLWFFLSGRSELRLRLANFRLNLGIMKEIGSIGGVTLARQGTISLLAIILNNTLFTYGGEISISVYGIINRVMMFANFPVLGVTQGFMPIAGYNYGAQKWGRVKKVINTAMGSGTLIALGIFACIMLFADQIVWVFSDDPELIEKTAPALRKVFLATPLITIQLVGSAYFQAIGKALPALLLTLTKQGFFLIPLILILPPIFELDGVWYAFPVADVMAAGITFWYVQREISRTINRFVKEEKKVEDEVAVG
jgi:putative MATE family efflux protein